MMYSDVFLNDPRPRLKTDFRTHSVQHNPRVIRARERMSSYVEVNQLHLAFDSGPAQSWPLPQRSDKEGIRAVREGTAMRYGRVLRIRAEDLTKFGQETGRKA
jgi:hypothetical protein